jgi:hypothetical protein
LKISRHDLRDEFTPDKAKETALGKETRLSFCSEIRAQSIGKFVAVLIFITKN